jgi:hypothetical protein
MMDRSTLRRRVAALAFALTVACGPVPEASRAVPVDAEPHCHEGHDGPVSVTICDVTDPGLLHELRAGRWLPSKVRALRAKSPLIYGRADSAAMDALSVEAKKHGSYIVPHFDMQHSIRGWDLYDAERHIAILSLDLDDRWVLVYSQIDATNDRPVLASLQRFLGPSIPIANRAQILYPP